MCMLHTHRETYELTHMHIYTKFITNSLHVALNEPLDYSYTLKLSPSSYEKVELISNVCGGVVREGDDRTQVKNLVFFNGHTLLQKYKQNRYLINLGGVALYSK